MGILISWNFRCNIITPHTRIRGSILVLSECINHTYVSLTLCLCAVQLSTWGVFFSCIYTMFSLSSEFFYCIYPYFIILNCFNDFYFIISWEMVTLEVEATTRKVPFYSFRIRGQEFTLMKEICFLPSKVLLFS